MNYLVNGKPVTLTDKDFLAEGGEGKVFVKGNYAYKLFHDLKKAAPKAKLLELAKLDRPEILGPRALIENDRGATVGFVMPYGKGEPLCKFFTETFRAQVGFTHDDASKLAARMQDVLEWIHQNRVLVVDYNEHNLLVGPKEEPLHVDVSAWQTPSFPATALMEHVRDPKVRGLAFTEGSDWFSFAVVLTQLYLGVHPYRGRHKDFKPIQWRQMMEKQISIFNRDTRMPPGTRDFSCIPRGHRDWLEAILEHGERTAPPAPGSTGPIANAPVPVPSSGKVRLELVRDYPGRIRQVYFGMGATYVVTDTGVYQGADQIAPAGQGVNPVLLPVDRNDPVVGYWNRPQETLGVQLGPKKETVSTPSFTVVHDKLWTTDGTYLREHRIVKLGQNPMISTRPAAPALPTSRFGDGVLVQPMPGGDRFTILLKTGGVQTFKIVELAGWRILSATGRHRVLQVLARRGNDLQLVTTALGPNGLPEKTVTEPWADYTAPSLAVTSKGITVRLTDTELRLWKDINQPMIHSDPGLAGAMLWVDGIDVFASEGKKLWRVRT